MKDYAVSVVLKKESSESVRYNHGLAILSARSRSAAIEEYTAKQLEDRPASDGWQVLTQIAQEIEFE